MNPVGLDPGTRASGTMPPGRLGSGWSLGRLGRHCDSTETVADIPVPEDQTETLPRPAVPCERPFPCL